MMSGFNRSRRLLVSEILEKGLDPTLPYSKLDKKGKLSGVPDVKQRKNSEEEHNLSLQEEKQVELENSDLNAEVSQEIELEKVEDSENLERIDLTSSSRSDGTIKKVKKSTKKKKVQV